MLKRWKRIKCRDLAVSIHEHRGQLKEGLSRSSRYKLMKLLGRTPFPKWRPTDFKCGIKCEKIEESKTSQNPKPKHLIRLKLRFYRPYHFSLQEHASGLEK